MKVLVLKLVLLTLGTFGFLLYPSLNYPQTASAATEVYTVQAGDSLWKIAVKYEVGLSEIIEANKQFANPAMIYPNQKVNIPLVSSTVKNVESEVAQLVNQQRAKAGLKPLTMDWQISRVARTKAQDMQAKRYFSHQSPTYGSPFDMMRKFNIAYRSAGENIAQGQRSAQEVMNAWMNSSGHRANIMNPSFTHIGVGFEPNGNYWVQMFVGR